MKPDKNSLLIYIEKQPQSPLAYHWRVWLANQFIGPVRNWLPAAARKSERHSDRHHIVKVVRRKSVFSFSI